MADKDDKPRTVRIQPGGKMTKRENPDGSMSVSSKEHLTLEMDSIKSIGIENIVDVEVHSINKAFGAVSHYIKFHGGGEIRFSFNAKGELLEFSANDVAADVKDGERIIFKRKSPPPRE